jgi:hypothetical protein
MTVSASRGLQSRTQARHPTKRSTHHRRR